ncbi:hypothetical protein L2E82_08041 [Cichorium intybus]|uniref:Uncharacterized protein n=1 Tax=Cichorium intybus TaxID=13427 RepID=A0ACB9G4W3_CICIN|nr:hypothetical protein L2E82_08041 [Cichorium intybus]
MAALGAASAQLESRCKQPCGNVTIEYPFGYEGCYYNPDFLVTCNQTSGIRVSTNNTFVAIGCDTSAFIRGTRGKVNDVTGCFSRCLKDSLITSSSCSGVGCCEAAVPGGMSAFNISVTSYNNHTNITDFNPCSYAFFLKNGKYNFSAVDLRDFQRERMPMLLDWSIGNLTCNSRCDENYGGPGYCCRCNEGYVGNPYIANNCTKFVTNEMLDHLYSTDINECANRNHDCRHKCIDTEGSYKCKCRKGFSGDGKKGGSGCTAEQSMVIKIAVGSSAAAIFLIVFVNWLYFGLKKLNITRNWVHPLNKIRSPWLKQEFVPICSIPIRSNSQACGS